MNNEFEIVTHAQFPYLTVFLVRLFSRTRHIHRDLELGVVLEGTLTIHMGQSRWQVAGNEPYLINPMQAHELSSQGEGALVLAIQVSPKLMEPFLPNASMLRYEGPPPLGKLLPPREKEELLSCCRELACAYFAKPEHYELACFRGITDLIYRLHVQLPIRLLSRQEYLPIQHRTDRMAAITDYIDQNFQRKLLLEEIAKQQGLTMPHLSHLFRDTLGISFQEYLKQKRFEHACMLLANTQRSILDISMECGFSDVRYLTQIFRQRFNCTPRQYRNREQDSPLWSHPSHTSMQYFLTQEEALARLVRWQQE